MQATLIIGDTLDFPTTVTGRAASAGYTLRYYLTPRVAGVGSPITITASAEGDNFRVYVPPAVTTTWVAGDYSWSSRVTSSGGDVYTIESGTTTLQINPATATVYDNRTPARIALDAAYTAMAQPGNIKRYVIAGREVEYIPQADLIKRIEMLQLEVNREERDAARLAGQPDKRRVYLRCSNA